MNTLNGKEVLSILQLNAERSNFKYWDRPVYMYDNFLRYIYNKVSWSQWYNIGYLDGAISLNYLINIEIENTAEYQCLLHHFCCERELVNVG